MPHAQFRFYEELNDFLPSDQWKRSLTYTFNGHPAVKNAVEAQGVPHTEVDLILINGQSVDFSAHLRNGDRVSVYPVFESLDISPVQRLRSEPLRETKFILDTQLGGLARKLRMVGFDSKYQNDFKTSEIIQLALLENRIILTRHVGLLKHRDVTHGFWVRSDEPRTQIEEVIRRFDLMEKMTPFNRCMVCNGIIESIPKKNITYRLLPKTREYYNLFFQCQSCKHTYWKGTHYQRMLETIEQLKKRVQQSNQEWVVSKETS